MTLRLVHIAAIILFFVSRSAVAADIDINVTVHACDSLDAEDIREIAVLELNQTRLATSVEMTLSVSVHCDGKTMRIRAWDPVLRRSLERAVSLQSFEEQEGERTIGIVISQLYIARWSSSVEKDTADEEATTPDNERDNAAEAPAEEERPAPDAPASPPKPREAVPALAAEPSKTAGSNARTVYLFASGAPMFRDLPTGMLSPRFAVGAGKIWRNGIGLQGAFSFGWAKETVGESSADMYAWLFDISAVWAPRLRPVIGMIIELSASIGPGRMHSLIANASDSAAAVETPVEAYRETSKNSVTGEFTLRVGPELFFGRISVSLLAVGGYMPAQPSATVPGIRTVTMGGWFAGPEVRLRLFF